MAEKSPHEIYTAALRLRGFRKDNYSDLFLKDVSENLFQKIKEFNEYYKLDSWDEVLNDDIAYNEISKHLGLKKTAYETLVKYGISEAKGERDFNFSYKKILNGINELKAELNSPDNRERWHTKEGTTELFNVKWTYLYHPDMEFVITRSQLKESIEKLEECKKYLEIKHPDLITPTPKDDPSPVPDEIDPQSAPNEAPEEDYSGFEWVKNKADLAELIKGLFYTDSIKKDGSPVSLFDLQTLFEKLFNETISDIDKSFSSRMNTYQAEEDGKTFLKKMINANRENHEKNQKK